MFEENAAAASSHWTTVIKIYQWLNHPMVGLFEIVPPDLPKYVLCRTLM